MDLYLLTLRIVHIGAAVFWVGSFFLFFYFIEPTAKALGPAGAPFMGHLTEKRKMPLAIVIASTVTVLAGVLLYWDRSNGFDLGWITSSTGMSFTLGGVAAIIAWLVGIVAVRPAVERMGALGAEIQGSGGPPSGAQATELEGLMSRLKALGRFDAVLLTFAVVAMASARYL